MAKSPGLCIFCDKPGRLTKQHVWPKWLKKYNLPEDTHHYQVTAEANYRNPTDIKSSAKRLQGHSGARRFRKVCRTCNGGWIRQIEESVTPFVLAMMDGNFVTLSRDEQRRLSVWLALVAIMSEFTDPRTMAIPPEHRHWLKQRIEPAAGWMVWIGRYSGSNWRQHVLRHYGMQLEPSPDENVQAPICDTQTTTLVIGQLCAHIFSSTNFTDFPGYEGQTLIPIWPLNVGTITWGTSVALTDSGVISLSGALARAIPPAPPDAP